MKRTVTILSILVLTVVLFQNCEKMSSRTNLREGTSNGNAEGAASTTPPPATETVGPRMAVGPQADPGCEGVFLKPVDDLQKAVDAAGENTTFCLAAGVYANQSVRPKNGDRFIGAKGAKLDGRNRTFRAFESTASNVTIKNLIITNYTAGSQDAPIRSVEGRAWLILQNEVSYNAGIGVVLGPQTELRGNYLHHNAQAGYGAGLKWESVILDSNEIAFNNYQDKFDPGWEAGGGKLAITKGAKILHNHSHDNHGPGLWTDIDNIDTTYAFNRVEDNTGGGIFHEISYDASIHDNLVKNNARGSGGWLWNAGIQISSSGGTAGGLIEIYANTVVSNASGNAIGVMQQDRSRDPCTFGPCLVQNVYVHDNVIDVSAGGNTGFAQDIGDTAIFNARNNRSDYNTYILGTNTSPFFWNDRTGPRSLMTKGGQELHATFR